MGSFVPEEEWDDYFLGYHPTFVQFEHFALASDESLTGRREPEIYWVVNDGEAAYQEFSQTARIALSLTQKPFGKVFAIQDPAGRPRFLLEWSAQRPSQAV